MPTAVTSIAHRGGIVAGFPENTLVAFREAVRQGAHVIEFDLRATRDGEIVVMHDATLDRTTNGHGRVTDRTLAQLRQLDAGGGEHIPTYEEVLQLLAGTDVQLLLDIKESPQLDKHKVVRLAERYNALGKLIVGPRNLADLQALRQGHPDLRTLGFIREVADIEPFVQAGVDVIRLKLAWIRDDPGLIARVHRLGKPVWVTADDAPRAEIEKLIRMGADGIISDFPALLHAVLADVPGKRGRLAP